MDITTIPTHTEPCQTCASREARLTAWAEDYVRLEAELADARADVAIYRELTREALGTVHRLTEQNRRLRICLARDLTQRFGSGSSMRHREAA